jgi:hypothetical protein
MIHLLSRFFYGKILDFLSAVNSISTEEYECGIISVKMPLAVWKTFSVTKGLDVLCKYSFVYTHTGEAFAVGYVLLKLVRYTES